MIPVRLLLAWCLCASAVAPIRAELTPDQKERIEAAAPEKARVQPRRSRKVLIWNTPFMERSPHKGYTIPQGAYALKVLGEKTGVYEAEISDDLTHFLPEKLSRFDAVIMNNSNGEWIRPQPEELPRFEALGDSVEQVEQRLRQNFLGWVRRGGGVMALHHAISGNTHWPEFTELLGAGYWGHPWNEEVAVKLEEPGHPLLAAFAGRGFRLHEEIYQFKEPYDRGKVRVLLSLDTEETNMNVRWIHRTDGDFALAWVRPYGRGRVFYCAFGHRTEHWWNRVLLRFYLDAVQFVMGDLPGPVAPLPAE